MNAPLIAPHEASDDFVRIRPYRDEDAEALYEAVRESIDEVAPWLPWCHPGYSRDESEAWVASRGEAWCGALAYSFAVVNAQSGAFIGGCGLNQLNDAHPVANLGYWTRTSQAGRGAATAATRLVARFGFEQLGLVRIEVIAALPNVPSQRVAEKAGAAREGTLRHRLNLRGTLHDAVLFSLIPADLGLPRAATC